MKKTLSLWQNYYATNPIIDVPIRALRVKHLREWAYALIRENDMTRKEFMNAATWMKQMLTYRPHFYTADEVRNLPVTIEGVVVRLVREL